MRFGISTFFGAFIAHWLFPEKDSDKILKLDKVMDEKELDLSERLEDKDSI